MNNTITQNPYSTTYKPSTQRVPTTQQTYKNGVKLTLPQQKSTPVSTDKFDKQAAEPQEEKSFWKKKSTIIASSIIGLALAIIAIRHFKGAKTTPKTNASNKIPPETPQKQELPTETFHPNGNLEQKIHYDENGKIIKMEGFQEDGKTPTFIKETLSDKEVLKKFKYDGKTVEIRKEFDLNTDKQTLEIHFHKDGKTPKHKWECNPKTGLPLTETHYKQDGKSIKYFGKFDEKGRTIEKQRFNDKGKLTTKIKLDPETEKEIYSIEHNYLDTGDYPTITTVKINGEKQQETIFNAKNGNKKLHTDYGLETGIKRVENYDEETGLISSVQTSNANKEPIFEHYIKGELKYRRTNDPQAEKKHTMEHFCSDGRTDKSFYNSDGKLIKHEWRNKDNKLTEQTLFDAQTEKMTSIESYFQNGEVKRLEKWDKDTEKPTFYETYHPDGSLRSKAFYNNNQVIQKKEHYRSDGKLYRQMNYNDKGEALEYKDFRTDGSLKRQSFSDENKNIAGINYHRPDGTIYKTATNIDENLDNPVVVTTFDKENNPTTRTLYNKKPRSILKREKLGSRK